jgi:hypothetical protein
MANWFTVVYSQDDTESLEFEIYYSVRKSGSTYTHMFKGYICLRVDRHKDMKSNYFNHQSH